MKSFNIGNFKIGDNSKVFIVAELSANHNHKLEIAIETIKAAKKAGADAIKLQTYTPDTITINCKNKYFMIKTGIWKGKSLYELYKDAFTPWEWHKDLFKIAEGEGLMCFSTPFDRSSVDFLEKLNNPIYKISSFEIQDIELIKYIASLHKPIFISTGIADLMDIELAIKTCRENGNNNIIILKCTSSYPTPLEEANLLTIPDLKNRFGVEVGISDHSLGNIVPIVATTLGAKVIEKHFIIDKGIGGPDASFSLDSKEFSEMVTVVRETEKVKGLVDYTISKEVEENRIFGRSLFAVQVIRKGERIDQTKVKSIRPGYGLHPKYLPKILGSIAKCNIPRGTPIDWKHISL